MFLYSRQYFQSLHLIHTLRIFLLLCAILDLIIQIPSAKLSTRFDNELAINLDLSTNYNL